MTGLVVRVVLYECFDGLVPRYRRLTEAYQRLFLVAYVVGAAMCPAYVAPWRSTESRIVSLRCSIRLARTVSLASGLTSRFISDENRDHFGFVARLAYVGGASNYCGSEFRPNFREQRDMGFAHD